MNSAELRVNGIPYSHVNVRNAFVDGHPSGPRELTVLDSHIGEITLTDDLEIEVRWFRDKPFNRVSTRTLIGLLEDGQVEQDFGTTA